MAKIPSPCGLGEELGALFDEVEALGVQAQTLATQLKNADAKSLANLVGNVASTMIAQNTGLMTKADAFSSTVSGISPPSLLDEVFDKVKTLENVLSQPGLPPEERAAALLKFADDMDLLQGKYAEKMTEYGIDLTKLVDFLQTGDITPKMLCDILPNVSILPDGSSLEKALPIEFPETGINDIIATANDVVANAQSKLLQVDKMLTAPASLRLLVGGDPSSDVINSVKNMLPAGTAKNLLTKEISNLTSSYNKAADFIAELTDFSSSDVKTKSIAELVTTVKSNEDRLDPPDETVAPVAEEGTLYVNEDPFYQSTSYDEVEAALAGSDTTKQITVVAGGNLIVAKGNIDGDPGNDGEETTSGANRNPIYFRLTVSSPTVSSTSKRTATAICQCELVSVIGTRYGRYSVTKAVLLDHGAGYTEAPEIRLDEGVSTLTLDRNPGVGGLPIFFPTMYGDFEDTSPNAGQRLHQIQAAPVFSGVFASDGDGSAASEEPSVMDKLADLIEQETGTRPDWADDGDPTGTGDTDWTQYLDDWSPDTNTLATGGYDADGNYLDTGYYYFPFLDGPREGSCWSFFKVAIDTNTEANYIKLNVNDVDLNGGATTEVIGYGYGLNSIDYRQTNVRQFQTRRYSLSTGEGDNYENYNEGTAAITGSALFVDGPDIVFEQYYDFNPLDLFNPDLDYALWKRNESDAYWTSVGLQAFNLSFFRDINNKTQTYHNIWNSNGVPNNVTIKVIGGETQVVDKLNKGPRIQVRFDTGYPFYDNIVSWMQSFDTALANYKNGSDTRTIYMAMGFGINDTYI